jgi:hypothetical protein
VKSIINGNMYFMMEEGFSFLLYGCHPCMLKNVIHPLWIDDTIDFMNVI